ncbi:hypothetical protein ACKLNO_07040 [Neisseriaceae bacterium B1]
MGLFKLVEQIIETDEFLELDEKLQELQKIDPNFTPEFFKDVILSGHYEMQDTSDYDLNAIGAFWQGHLTRFLRKRLRELGWTTEKWKGGAFLTVSPCKTKSIVVAIGTSDVGKSDTIPTTSARKGVAVERAIMNGKLNLPETCTLWVLLFHYNRDTLQYELSQPKDFIKGYVTGYSKRILFDDISLNPISEPEISRQTSEPAEIVEPTVERKKKAA